VFRLVVQSGMLGVGAWLAVKHEISSGSIVASSIILGRALAPIEQAVGGWQQFLNARRSYERLSQLLGNLPPAAAKTALPKPQGEVVVEGLAIVMPGSEKPLLQGINFRLAPGKGLGIIGPTGAGKSTLARALVGLVPAQHGSIRLDGATAEQRDGDELGRLIGYLPQDVQIFDGTVAENIGRFSSGEDSMKVVQAAKLARIHEFILRLPKGYDTPLGNGGARLSAGQRQRLALARALYGDPVFLVLDEPNSNLDSEGEAALDGAIRGALARGASVIIVTHRPSALQAVESVIVLAGGTMAMAGPRDEILAKLAARPPQPAAPPQRISSTSMSLSTKITQPGSDTRN
jgi:PrtD family type I secretion system ABC transporter